MVDTEGANVDTGQLTADKPGNGSVTPTDVNVTLPLLVTTNEYATLWPAAVTVVGNADFAIVINGNCVAVTVAESVSVTAGPTGGVPLVVAVFTIEPAFMSDSVTVYDAVHVVDSDGANVDTGHDTTDKPGNGSVTTTDVNVTLPLLVTTNEYATISPAAVTAVGNADFTIVIDGNCVAVTVSESESVTAGPVGGVPVAVAVFRIEPESMSATVTVYDAVHVVDPEGANVDTGHDTTDRPGNGSVTATEVNVTLPSLFTTNE